ncbi:MAG: hypothetical protein U0R19_00395 [Bryobacteraceae bacterium]
MIPADLTEFCRTAAARVRLPKGKFLPEQMQSVIGGICNLYLGRMIDDGHLPVWTIETHDALASEAVPLPAVLAQIHYCSGVSRKHAPLVLQAFVETLKETCGGEAAHVSVSLPGMGSFSPIDPKHAHYWLTIADTTSVSPRPASF